MSLIAKPKITDIPDGICCICQHPLSRHIEEKNGWRCHALGPDLYQCECFLRKNRYKEGKKGYDLKRRSREHVKEYREGWG